MHKVQVGHRQCGGARAGGPAADAGGGAGARQGGGRLAAPANLAPAAVHHRWPAAEPVTTTTTTTQVLILAGRVHVSVTPRMFVQVSACARRRASAARKNSFVPESFMCAPL